MIIASARMYEMYECNADGENMKLPHESLIDIIRAVARGKKEERGNPLIFYSDPKNPKKNLKKLLNIPSSSSSPSF